MKLMISIPKFRLFFITVLLAILAISKPIQAETILEQVLSSGVLKAGATGDWDPMTVYDSKTDSYSGYDIDMFTELAKDLGVKLELVPLTWREYNNSLQERKIHISGSAAITPKRLRSVGLSESYFSNGFLPLINVNQQQKFKTWESLNSPDVTIASTPGTVFISVIQNWAPLAKVEFTSHKKGLAMVADGSADAFITSVLEYQFPKFREQHPKLIAAVNPGDYRDRAPYAVMLPKGDQEWINLVNSWIILKKESGFFDDFLKDYASLPESNGR